MALETFPYDAAELITGPQDVFYFLEAELEMEEPAYWPGAIEIVARSRGGFERLAEESGIAIEQLRSAADKSTAIDRADMVRLMEAYRSAVTENPHVAQASHAR